MPKDKSEITRINVSMTKETLEIIDNEVSKSVLFSTRSKFMVEAVTYFLKRKEHKSDAEELSKYKIQALESYANFLSEKLGLPSLDEIVADSRSE